MPHLQYAANYWKHTYGEEAPVNVVKRFSDETHRLYKVLDEQLAKQEWVALDRPTIADFACESSVLLCIRIFKHSRCSFPLSQTTAGVSLQRAGSHDQL